MLIVAVMLVGCTSTTGDFCIVSSPIRPSAQDTLTDGTARQILAHNEYGARACSWR